MDNKPGPKTSKTAFGFMDEVGLLHSPKEDRVFGLGLLKLQHPTDLHREIIRYKNKSNFHNEFKFSEIRDSNLKLYKGLLDVYLTIHHTKFSCIIFDKSGLDINKFFKNDYYKAYNAFTAKLIAECLEVSEYIMVLADDISTPKSDHFEKEVKEKVRNKTRRNALFGICRIESHAVSEIQMVDLLLGVIAYSFKIKYKLITPNRKSAKFRLVKYLQKHLNIDQLSESITLKMKFGRRLEIKEFTGNLTKKIDSALGETAN